MQEAAQGLINNYRALTNGQNFESLTLMVTQTPCKNYYTCSHQLTQHTTFTFQDRPQTHTQTGTKIKINLYAPNTQIDAPHPTANACVPLLLAHIFHFITSLVCDDRDKTVVTEMSGRGEEKGVWNWTGNYVLQLRHAEEILKAILHCLETGCRKGGCNGRRQFNQNPRLSHQARGCRKGGKRDRTAMFNNVLGISVVECTIVYKIHGVI